MGREIIEIIILATIAGFLVLRLRSVLGRRTGNERPPPKEIASQRPADAHGDGNVVELPDRGRRAEMGDADAPVIDESNPAAAGLTQIQIADRNFNPADFVGGARAAFEMIVHAFATGDTGTLRTLLSEEVFENFSAEIQSRIADKETLETTIIGIKSADIIDARLDGTDAFVEIKFVSEQVNVRRDTDGRVVEGDPNQITDIIDLWTFSRNLRSRDPNWKLVATREPN